MLNGEQVNAAVLRGTTWEGGHSAKHWRLAAECLAGCWSESGDARRSPEECVAWALAATQELVNDPLTDEPPPK